MRLFTAVLATLSFVAGLAVGSVRTLRLSGPAEAFTDLSLHTQLSKCAGSNAGYPLPPVCQLKELQPARHPIQGWLARIMSHGRQQQRKAPAPIVPVHWHACQERVLITAGSGIAAMQGRSGPGIGAAAGSNLTVLPGAVLPGTRHQLQSTGREGLR